MPPHMVSERDHVGAGREDLVREFRGQPEAVGGVLAVDDAEGRAQLLTQAVETRLQRPATRGADDVCDEEDDQCGPF